MKVDNLIKGMILKNYKELCSVLGIEPKKTGSNSYKSQLKEFETRFEFHKEGHKIIIDKIYKEGKSKVDKRTDGNNSKYIDDMEYLILSLLSKFKIKKDEKIGFSKNFLYSHCGLINDNYRVVKGNALKFSEMTDMPIQTINECFDYTNNRMLKALQRTLNKMQRQSLITWGNGYNMVMMNEDGQQYLKVASIEDEKIIMAVERELMNKMGASNKRLIFISGLWENFKSKANSKIKEYYPDLCYYYDNICFNYNNKDINSALKKYENTKKNEAKLTINNKFSKSLDGTINRRHEKAKTSDDNSVFNNYRKSEEYPKEQKIVKNTIVKNDSKKIKLKSEYDKTKVKSLQRSFFDKYSNEPEKQLNFNDFDVADIPF